MATTALDLFPLSVPFVDMKTGRLSVEGRRALVKLLTLAGGQNGFATLGELVDGTGTLTTQNILAMNTLGFATGAGGTVTQLVSKAQPVLLNESCGEITMDNALLAANTAVSFVLTNDRISGTDVMVVNHVAGGTLGSYSVNAACSTGSATMTIRNLTAGGLSDAVVLRFAVIQAVTS